MDKKEARIKCSGCGTPYKLRLPVTDKPVSFKCKQCGKVLKLKIKSVEEKTDFVAPPEPPSDLGPIPEFETTQLPDDDYFQDQSYKEYHKPQQSAPSLAQPSVVESHFFAQSVPQPPASEDKDRRWVVLMEDVVKGPFTDQEILSMIKDGEVSAETSIRMGERPWVKAVEVANFRQYFSESQRAARDPLQSISLLEKVEDDSLPEGPPRTPFQKQWGSVLPYPISGKIPFAIFAGIALVISTVLTFDVYYGLPLNLIGWTILYGYLDSVSLRSRSDITSPPSWDFAKAVNMLSAGAKTLGFLMVYSMIPSVLLLVVSIALFLNEMSIGGYIGLILTILVFISSLFLMPAGLVILETSGNLAAALNPLKMVKLIKTSGSPYKALAMVSLGAGLLCLLAVVGAVFLVDIPDAGFIVAGVVLALVLSYCNFVWFHVLGRFCGENKSALGKVFSSVPA